MHSGRGGKLKFFFIERAPTGHFGTTGAMLAAQARL
jgi:hypothetical protein